MKNISNNHDTNVHDPLVIAGREFTSRLLVGTGKYRNPQEMAQAVESSGAEIVTVSLRRVDLDDPEDHILKHIDPAKYLILPNTSGARDSNEAVRLARLARSAGVGDWVKLEVTPDPRYLLPDPVETLKAAEILIKDGFTVLPYINADPVLAKKLADLGCATVMPLGSPIGSNQGIKTKDSIAIIIEQATVPVVVDAGLGAPSHAAEALEMGADAVLVNTALSAADDPGAMGLAFKKGVEAGREGYLAGIRKAIGAATASSPETGLPW